VIEQRMVERMTKHALLVGPVLVALLWLWGGVDFALSGAVGIVMTLLNLWLAARIIGSVAERNPQMLMPTALATFALGLIMLTAIAFALRYFDAVVFPVTGLVLIGSHLGLVLWEAAGARETAVSLDEPTKDENSLRSKEPKNAGF
jgi:hypothetical protein